MKGSLVIASILFLSLTSSALAADHKRHSPAPAVQYKSDRVLVTFKDGTRETAMADAHSQVGGKEIRRYANFPNLKVVSPPTGMSVEDAIQRYRKLSAVKSAGLR